MWEVSPHGHSRGVQKLPLSQRETDETVGYYFPTAHPLTRHNQLVREREQPTKRGGFDLPLLLSLFLYNFLEYLKF